MNRFKLAYIIFGIGMAAAIIVAVSVTLVEQRGGGDNNSSTTTTQGDNVETVPSAAPSELTLTGGEPATIAPSPAPSFLRATSAPTSSSDVTPSPTGLGDNSPTTISPAPSISTTTNSPTSKPPVPTAPSDTVSPSSSAPIALSPTAGTSSSPTVTSTTQSPTAAAVPTTTSPSASPTSTPLSPSPVTSAPSSSPPVAASTPAPTTEPPTTPAPSSAPPTTLAPTISVPLIAPSSGTFKILQLSDLHLGESIHNDRSTWQVLDVVLNEESPIDLIVLSGDIASSNVSDASSMYEELGNFLSSYNTPWAVLFGEADDAPGSDATTTSRQELVQVTEQFELSLTQSGPSDVFGTSNYMLNVWNSQQSSVAAQVVLLDTGGGSLPQQLTESQATWFTNQRTDDDTPAFVFQHIPTSPQFEFDQSRCSGLNGDGGISPLQGGDGDMMSTLSADGNVWFVAVGHNHGNDYCCALDSVMHICFARHSGYGGYSGVFGRGARVYEVQFQNDVATSWQSHVRLEFGFVVDPYNPNSS